MTERKPIIQHLGWLVVVLAAALSIGAQAAQAADHDLDVTGVWAEPEALTCGSKVCARIYVAGEADNRIESGQVVIRFSAQTEGGTWSVIGEVPVTWGPSEQGLEKEAVKVVCIEFNPGSSSNYQFRAEAVYPSGTVDGYPADNTGDSSWYTVASVCMRPPEGCRAAYVGGRWTVVCPVPFEGTHRPPPLDKCKVLPLLCEKHPDCAKYPWACPGLDLCKLDPRSCGVPGPFKVFIDDRATRMNFALIDATGALKAKAEPLPKPISEGGTTYTLGLGYTASPGEKYYLVIWPTGDTKLGATLPFSVLVKQGAEK